MVQDPHLPKMCGLFYAKYSFDIGIFFFLLRYKSIRMSSFGQNQEQGQHAIDKLVQSNTKHKGIKILETLQVITSKPVHKSLYIVYKSYILKLRDYPGGLVGKTLHSKCRGPGSDPWSGN